MDESQKTVEKEGEDSELSLEELQAQVEDLNTELASQKLKLEMKERESSTQRKKIELYEQKIAEFREFVKKMEKEVETVRERSKREVQREIESEKASLFKELLPVVDNFELALQSGASSQVSEADKDGMRLIYKQLQDVLSKAGLEKVQTTGEVFNPEIHEAVTTMPVEVESLDEQIVQEVRAGYTLGEKVVRSPQVIVGKYSA